MRKRHNHPLRAQHRVTIVAMLLAVSGCSSPLYDRRDTDLRRSVRESAERELLEANRFPEPRTLSRTDRIERYRLPEETLRELEATSGPKSYLGLPDLGPSLYGTSQETATVSLQEAVASAVQYNLNLEFARLAPAISQAQVIAADAAFDWILFSSGQWGLTDQPRTSPAIGGSTVGIGADQRQVVDGTIGVRRALTTGGQFTVQHQLTYTDVETPNLFTSPDPANETNIVIQFDQPLLRNFGSDVALAQVRLSQNAERDEIQNLRGQLNQTVTQVEVAYWNLVRAVQDVHITLRLLERGKDVLETITNRRLDVKQSDIADAASQVASREADVLQAQKSLRDVSDQLKSLMNDPRYPVGSVALLIPVDTAVDQPIRFTLIDSLNSAFSNRPEVQRALISLDNTAIRQVVADNARLPLLNLRALSRISSMEANMGDAYDSLTDANFVDYQIRLDFEQPIGNRAAEAGYTARRLERQQATIALRNTMQGVVAEVKAALRDVELNYVLIGQRREARIAAAETLRTLLVEEQFVRALTPEFLDLKLRRQQTLASAEQTEISALIEYNTAMARLHLAMGTILERNRIMFDVPAFTPDKRIDFLFPDADAVRPKRFDANAPVGNR
ncbi:MAG: TolC family protein [Phycisphaeraceae bacterium]|nr:TolC family protein [Phycisphaeraceae bacterium]